MKPTLLKKTNFFIFFLLLFALETEAQFRQVYNGFDKNDDVNGMSFINPSTGFVAFSKFIGYTQDSGKTYTKKTIAYGNTNFNGYIVNLTFGFHAVGVIAFSKDSLLIYGDFGSEPSILFSADQGDSWKLVFHLNFNGEIGNTITDMKVVNNTGIAVYHNGLIRTTNKGQNWSLILLTDNLNKLSSPSANTFYAIGQKQMFKSINGGASWSSVTLPPYINSYANFNNVFFITNNFGYISQEDVGKVFMTNDGGINWRKMNDETKFSTRGSDMFFTNDSTGFLTPGVYQIYKTTDSGKIWEPCLEIPNYQYLYYILHRIYFLNSEIGWAGGAGEYLMITSNNGGQTIPRVYFNIDTTLLSSTENVKLVNYTKEKYQFKWFKNDTLISTEYNTSYKHIVGETCDTIMLIASNISGSDTMIKYQFFNLPPPPLFPKVISFIPTSAATGKSVTITGENLGEVTKVTFGGIEAFNFKINSTTSLTAIVGNGNSGYVSVTSKSGSDSLDGFTYLPPPVINSFTPIAGITGTLVTITGSNFSNATNVNFGGVTASSFTVVSSNTITASVGRGASGLVSVTTPSGTGSLAGFIYYDPPQIISVNPDFGVAGTEVTIIGRFFLGTTKVLFGGVNAASFKVISSDTIRAIVGLGATGNVSVKTPYGISTSGIFTIKYPPTITAFTPTGAGNGIKVTITGTEFYGTGSVTFGGVPALSFSVISSTKIEAIVGTGTSGDIEITTPFGKATLAGFTFIEKAEITSFSPTACTAGTTVTIVGNNLSTATAVSFGGASVSSFTILSNTIIKAVIGLNPSGDVNITTGAGNVSKSGFTFIPSSPPQITEFTPSSGVVGSSITIKGSNFKSDISGNLVFFGSVKAVVTSASPYSLVVNVPYGASFEPISVTSGNLTAFSNKPFIVTFSGENEFNSNSFAGKIDFQTGASTSSTKTIAGDLDQDGKQDLIVLSGLGFSLFLEIQLLMETFHLKLEKNMKLISLV